MTYGEHCRGDAYAAANKDDDEQDAAENDNNVGDAVHEDDD